MKRGLTPLKIRTQMALTSRTFRNRRLTVVLLMIAAPAALPFAAKGWYDGGLRPVNAEAGAQGKDIHIERNAHVTDIATELRKEGLIRNARAFELYCRLSHAASHLQPGIYRFSPAMTVQEIAAALAEGRISAVRMSVPEGYTLKQIARHLAAEHFCKEEDFLAAARPYAVKGKVAFPRPPIDSLEGYLFPATYTFNLGLPPADAVVQMAREFDAQFLTKYQEDVRRSGMTLHQIVTLASLVEREAKLDEERPVIAGVLVNRLKKDMRLQCDATVQYALPEHKSRLTYEDLKVNSPYNTYRVKGLPPGPIASPGVPSLLAALHPASTPYLFYVARSDGGHKFTKTYEEHLKAAGKTK